MLCYKQMIQSSDYNRTCSFIYDKAKSHIDVPSFDFIFDLKEFRNYGGNASKPYVFLVVDNTPFPLTGHTKNFTEYVVNITSSVSLVIEPSDFHYQLSYIRKLIFVASIY